MAFHNCAIHTEDGTIVARDVKVNIEEANRGGVAEWYGTISVTHLTSLEAGRCYRMVLDDGRTGEFVVRRNTFAGGQDRAVAFRGSGPLE